MTYVNKRLWIGMAACLACGASANASATEVYKWTDSDGVMHLSDSPPPQSAQASELSSFEVSPAQSKAKPLDYKAQLDVAERLEKSRLKREAQRARREAEQARQAAERLRAQLSAAQQFGGGVIGTPFLGAGTQFGRHGRFARLPLFPFGSRFGGGQRPGVGVRPRTRSGFIAPRFGGFRGRRIHGGGAFHRGRSGGTALRR